MYGAWVGAERVVHICESWGVCLGGPVRGFVCVVRALGLAEWAGGWQRRCRTPWGPQITAGLQELQQR